MKSLAVSSNGSMSILNHSPKNDYSTENTMPYIHWPWRYPPVTYGATVGLTIFLHQYNSEMGVLGEAQSSGGCCVHCLRYSAKDLDQCKYLARHLHGLHSKYFIYCADLTISG